MIAERFRSLIFRARMKLIIWLAGTDTVAVNLTIWKESIHFSQGQSGHLHNVTIAKEPPK